LNSEVQITLSKDLGEGCLGLFHCGKNKIEILHPDQLAAMKQSSDLFAPLNTLTLFDSLVVHEMSHAAMAQVDCPFASCLGTHEYVAYAMQIWSLSPQDRTITDAITLANTPVTDTEISAIYALMAPERFAVKAYTHLMQRDDACGYLQEIAQGRVRFDFDIR
jgi:hypothetical protein